MTRPIPFTDEEVRGLLDLIDRACKHGGLAVAETCLYFARKLAPAPPKEG